MEKKNKEMTADFMLHVTVAFPRPTHSETVAGLIGVEFPLAPWENGDSVYNSCHACFLPNDGISIHHGTPVRPVPPSTEYLLIQREWNIYLRLNRNRL
jgi:hypothetical protein